MDRLPRNRDRRADLLQFRIGAWRKSEAASPSWIRNLDSICRLSERLRASQYLPTFLRTREQTLAGRLLQRDTTSRSSLGWCRCYANCPRLPSGSRVPPQLASAKCALSPSDFHTVGVGVDLPTTVDASDSPRSFFGSTSNLFCFDRHLIQLFTLPLI